MIQIKLVAVKDVSGNRFPESIPFFPAGPTLNYSGGGFYGFEATNFIGAHKPPTPTLSKTFTVSRFSLFFFIN